MRRRILGRKGGSGTDLGAEENFWLLSGGRYEMRATPLGSEAKK